MDEKNETAQDGLKKLNEQAFAIHVTRISRQLSFLRSCVKSGEDLSEEDEADYAAAMKSANTLSEKYYGLARQVDAFVEACVHRNTCTDPACKGESGARWGCDKHWDLIEKALSVE